MQTIWLQHDRQFGTSYRNAASSATTATRSATANAQYIHHATKTTHHLKCLAPLTPRHWHVRAETQSVCGGWQRRARCPCTPEESVVRGEAPRPVVCRLCAQVLPHPASTRESRAANLPAICAAAITLLPHGRTARGGVCSLHASGGPCQHGRHHGGRFRRRGQHSAALPRQQGAQRAITLLPAPIAMEMRVQ